MNSKTTFFINRPRLLFNLMCLLYFSLLLYVDHRFLTKHFAYSGFVDHFSLDKLLISIVCLFVSLLLFCQSQCKVKRFYQYVVLLFWLIPVFVHFTVTAGYYFLYVCFLSYVLMSIVIYSVKMPSVVAVDFAPLNMIVILCIVVFIISIIIMGGWRFFNLDITKVYEYRDAASQNLPMWYGYISSIISKVLIPVFIVLSLYKKKYLNVVFALFLSIVLFGLLAHKFILILPFIIVIMYFFSGKKYIGNSLVLMLIVMLLLSIFDFFLMENNIEKSGWFASIFSRRGLMIPVLLTDYYIDFFSHNPPFYWCNSKITLGLINCVYESAAPSIIGEQYYPGTGVKANTGMIGSGFANMAILGAVAYSIMIGFVISLFGSFHKNTDIKIIIPISFGPIITMIESSDFFTTLITHGLLFLIFICVFLPRSKYD